MAKMFEIGDQPLPGHTLQAFLGEGGFGEVWKAQNPHKIEVALKIVRIQGKQGLREVLAIRQLRNVRHPNLIPILGFWLKDQEGNVLENADTDGTSSFLNDGVYHFFLAMGLADKTLLDRLLECQKQGLSGIPLDELMQYMEESARALDFLNSATHNMAGKEKTSIEHCDIKPQNILVVGGSVQICDFGLARVLQHGVKQQYTSSYSPQYVAPELLKRELGPCRGTDQYSLAISFGQLRTGQLPFGDISFAPAILTAHLQGMLDFSFLPQREQVVLRRATSFDPEQRYPSVKAFVDALKESLGSGSNISRSNLPTRKGPLRAGIELIPGYALEETIGRGSFGEVWSASTSGGFKKALKIIRHLDMPSGRQEMRGLELITQVRHPHLIHIEAYYLLDESGEPISKEARSGKNAPIADTLVIVSELAECHLGARLKEVKHQTGNGIAPEELLPYMQQVAAALDCLNRQHDIIHRDVKPENILLVGSTAKLADFGLAKAMEGSSTLVRTKSIGMTPAYAAPELCQNRIAESTDQYSLALTYYHLRTGQLATGATTDIPDIIQAHLHGQLLFEGVTAAEELALRRASAFESRERFPSCASFVHALCDALRGTQRGDHSLEPMDSSHQLSVAFSTQDDLLGSQTIKSDSRISLTELPESIVIETEPPRPKKRLKTTRGLLATALFFTTIICFIAIAAYVAYLIAWKSDAKLLNRASHLINQQQYEIAAAPLLEVARRIASSTSKEFRDESLALTGEYLQQFPQCPENDKEFFINTYSLLANAFFEEQAERLRRTPKQVDWSKGIMISKLGKQNDPWLLAFLVEYALQAPTSEQNGMLQAMVKDLESLPESSLGMYGVYLQGAARARLNDLPRAAALFQTLSPESRDIEWETRRLEISSVMQSFYVDQKKKLFDEKNWKRILGDETRLQELGKSLESSARWFASQPEKDDQLIRFLSTYVGNLDPSQLQSALKLAREIRLDDIKSLSPALNLAFTAHYVSLLQKANAPLGELLPVAHRFITAIRSSESPFPPRELLTYLDDLVNRCKTNEVKGLSPGTRQQAAQLCALHGQILLENALASWAAEKRGLQRALLEFELAGNLVKENAPSTVEYQVWQTFTLLEMERPDWYSRLAYFETTTLPKKVQPLLLLLQAAKAHQSGRAAEITQEAQKQFKQAVDLYAAAIDGLKSDDELSGYVLNFARAGMSSAHNEYANQLVGQAQREHLVQAEALARAVISDARAGPAEARAQWALGSALESFGLILREDRTKEAVNAFTTAADRWKGMPQSARPLTDLGRILCRSRDERQWSRAETDLNTALSLVQEGEVASEANYWLAHIYERKQRYDAAQNTYARAEKLAQSSYFRDAAKCGSFAILIEAPLASPPDKSIAERIGKIKNELPRLAQLDPRLKSLAGNLRIRALQQLGNLNLLLSKFDINNRDNLIRSAHQQHELLAKETDEIARLYAARLAAQINFQLENDANALKDTEMDGRFEAYVQQLGTAQTKENPDLERAVLDLADTRFELLYDGLQKLNSELQANIKLVDQILRSTDKGTPSYAVLAGHGGLLRYAMLRHVAKLLEEKKPVDYTIEELKFERRKGTKLLEDAVTAYPHHRCAWKWYYALCDLSTDSAKREAYAVKSKEALKFYSEGNAEHLYSEIDEGLKKLLKAGMR